MKKLNAYEYLKESIDLKFEDLKIIEQQHREAKELNEIYQRIFRFLLLFFLFKILNNELFFNKEWKQKTLKQIERQVQHFEYWQRQSLLIFFSRFNSSRNKGNKFIQRLELAIVAQISRAFGRIFEARNLFELSPTRNQH